PPYYGVRIVSHPDHARWFHAEVEPHEPALRAYLRCKFPWLTDIDDLVQDAYVRLLRIDPEKIRNPRAFLFATAHNWAVNCSRRKQPIPLEELPPPDQWRVIEGGQDIPEFVNEQQELEILSEAVDALPLRCRAITALRHREG